MLMTIFEENRYFLVDLPVHIDSDLPKLDRLGIRRASFGVNLSNSANSLSKSRIWRSKLRAARLYSSSMLERFEMSIWVAETVPK